MKKTAIWYPFAKTLAIYVDGVIRTCFQGAIAVQKLGNLRDAEITICIEKEVTVCR